MARPSLYNENTAHEIFARLADGEPLKRICADPSMPDFVTVWRWERDNEEFRNLLARGRERGTHNLADQCLDIADDLDIDPQHKRLMIDTRIRLIGKWNAKAYGEKIGLTDGDGGPLQVVVQQFSQPAKKDD